MRIFRIWVIGAIALLQTAALNAQTSGTIAGIVTDSATGEPIVGATVLVDGTTKGVASDAEGRFSIAGLAAGTYRLDVSMISYDAQLVENIVVRQGETTHIAVSLTGAAEQVGEVVVSAVRRVNSEAALNVDIRNSLQVVSGVSSQAIARTQDRDAGEVVRRIPGISLIDDKFIIARGLSQRYNNVWIDQAAVPSSEADSRAFSFDLIPAGQIENILILKSPAPEVPADFTGGFIRIDTKEMPDDATVSFSYSTGVNTATHFDGFRYNPGPAGDLLGFGSGARMWEGGIKGSFDNSNAAFVDRATRSGFNNDWSVRKRSAVPDQRFSASFGRTWNLHDGHRFALTGAVNYSYSERSIIGMENSRFGIYNKREDKPEYLYKYTDDQYRTDVKLGAMFNMAYVRPRSSYRFRNIFNQLGQDRYTYRSGWQNISSLYTQEKAEYRYSSRGSYNGQFTGVHDLGRGRLDWTAGYSYANRHLPDRRIINRQENDIYGDLYYGKMQIDQNDMQRDFTRLVEHLASAGVNYERTFREGKRFAPKLKTGLYGDYRTRDYLARAFYYRFDSSNLPVDFAYGDPVADILVPENFGADKLYLYDDTDNRNSYKGDNLTAAAYAGINLPFGRLNIYAGVRFEHSDMTLTSYTRSKEWVSEERSYVYDDLFPSVNATYRITDRHQLRVAYGRSTNRPEFREVSASTYYDFDLFSTIMGNPQLKAAYIHNADLRYEWYPTNAEQISLSFFYKHFRNPIETTIRDAGGSYTYTYENADRARAYGVELDVRKNLAFMGLRNFSLSLNVAWIESRVFFDDASLEHDRPVQGQSPYIVNGGLFYQPERIGLTIGLLYNRIGKRIVGIGRSDLSSGGSVDNDIPDMYEMPRDALDFVATKRLGKCWELRISAKDLICDNVELCQFPEFTDDAGKLQRRKEITKQYAPGRGFSIGVSAKF